MDSVGPAGRRLDHVQLIRQFAAGSDSAQMLCFIDQHCGRAAIPECILDGLLQLVTCESPGPRCVSTVGGTLAFSSRKAKLVIDGRLLYLGKYPSVVIPPMK